MFSYITYHYQVTNFLIHYSWGSGANPWGPEKEDQFHKPTHYDGMLEVVGINGVVHMGQIFSGLRQGMRIAQGGHVSTSVHDFNILTVPALTKFQKLAIALYIFYKLSTDFSRVLYPVGLAIGSKFNNRFVLITNQIMIAIFVSSNVVDTSGCYSIVQYRTPVHLVR